MATATGPYVDQLLIEVPELLRISEAARDDDGEVLGFVLVGVFGGFVDTLLGGDRFRWSAEDLPDNVRGDSGVLARCLGVVERWAEDPDAAELLGAGFFEAFDEEGLERLAPHVGPATWAALQKMEAAQFAGREQPKAR